MKQIIRWVAKWSGVEQEIRDDERESIGCQIQGFHYWFTTRKPICNALWFVAQEVRKGGFFHYDKIRDQVLKLGDKRYNE